MEVAIIWMSLFLQLPATVLAFLIARRQRRTAWLLLAFATMVMVVRRLYMAYAVTAGLRSEDRTNEIMGAVIAALWLGGFLGVYLSLDAAPAGTAPIPIDRVAERGVLARWAFALGVLGVIGSIAVGAYAYHASVTLWLQGPLHPAPSLRATVLPWVVGFAVITLVVFPLSLGLLHRAYAASQQAMAAAAEEVRRNEVLYRRVLEAVPGGMVEISDDGTLRRANTAGQAVLGLRADESDRHMSAFGPDTMREDGSACPVEEYPAAICLRTRMPAGPTTIGIRQPDGGVTWAIFTAIPVSESPDGPSGTIVTFVDITQRKRAEEALRQSEERFRVAAQSASELIYEWDMKTNEVAWWGDVDSVLGAQAGAVVRSFEGWSDMISPDDMPRVMEAVKRAAEGGGAFFEEYRIRHQDGRWLVWTDRGMVMRDRIGKPCKWVGVINDVTEDRRREQALRESEEHYRQLAESNRRLLVEVNHRVRNNLAALMSLVSLTRRKTTGVDAFAEAMRGRLAAMAQVHNLLADGAYRELDLRELVSNLFASVRHAAPHRVEVAIDGPAVPINNQQAVSLAMAIQELFTNSVKHGAHSVPDGCVRIAWETHPATDQPGTVVSLTWKESGGPPVKEQISPSLGTELIEGFVNFELGGRCRLTFPTTGVEHLIEFTVGNGNAEA